MRGSMGIKSRDNPVRPTFEFRIFQVQDWSVTAKPASLTDVFGARLDDVFVNIGPV